MSATLRGANSSLSARLRRREDAARRQAPEVVAEEEAANPETPPDVVGEVSDAEKAALENFTVVELRARLKSIGASTSGKKSELIERLLGEAL